MYQQLIGLHFKIFMNNLHNFHKYANSQNIDTRSVTLKCGFFSSRWRTKRINASVITNMLFCSYNRQLKNFTFV